VTGEPVLAADGDGPAPAGETQPAGANEPESAAPAAPAAGEPFSVVRVTGIEVQLPSPHAVVVLAEVDEPHRSLAIPVGLPEATGLAHAWRALATARPLTHELFTDVLVRLGATVEVVRLLGRRAGVVLAELELSSPRGREFVPCRPSDALTLALRQKVPAPLLADARLFGAEGDVEPEDG
jgi:bifunctional DNase/RNase